MSRAQTPPTTREVSVRIISSLEARLQCYGPKYTFLLCYFSANLIMFCYGAVSEYNKWPSELFVAWNGAFARGLGSLVNLNIALSILLASRAVISVLRNTALSSIFPLDEAMPGMHSLVGVVLFAASTLHGFFHSLIITRVVRWQTGFGGYTWCFVTGCILLITIAAMTATAIRPSRQKKFEWFLWVHQTGTLIAVPLLSLHGFHNGVARTYRWLLGPCIVFCVDLVLRWKKSSAATITIRLNPCHSNVTICGNIVRLSVQKQFDYQAGQYAQICVPLLSKTQWHPFTIASAPHEDDFIFFIKCDGDWTRAFLELCCSGGRSKSKTAITSLDVRIRGPYGAPAQHSGQYDRILLIAGGVGSTPFCSVTKHVNEVISRQFAGLKESQPAPIMPRSFSCEVADTLEKESLPGRSHSVPRPNKPSISDMGKSFDIERKRQPEHQRSNGTASDIARRFSYKLASSEASSTLPQTWREVFYMLCCTTLYNILLLWVLLVRLSLNLLGFAFKKVDIGATGAHLFSSEILGVADFSLAVCFFVMLIFSSATELIVKRRSSIEDALLLIPASCVPIVIHILDSVGVGQRFGKYAPYNYFIVWPLLLVLTLWRYFRILGTTALLSDNVRHSHYTTKSVDFLWSTPTSIDDEWLLEELSRSVGTSTYVRLHRFITKRLSDIEAGEENADGTRDTEMFQESGQRIRAHYGRPDWDNIFDNLTRKMKNGSTTGIFFCGPKDMGVAVREAAMRNMMESRRRGFQYPGKASGDDEDVDSNTVDTLRSFNVRYVFREEKFM